MSDCLFCKIVSGEIPSKKLYEDDDVCAFYDAAPQAPTHFLVVPKRHVPGLGEITESGENAAAAALCLEAAAKIAKELGLASYRLVSNVGASAGQSVFHLHFHVLGGRDMAWPPG